MYLRRALAPGKEKSYYSVTLLSKEAVLTGQYRDLQSSPVSKINTLDFSLTSMGSLFSKLP